MEPEAAGASGSIITFTQATVKTHVRQILAKLGVSSRTQAALRAHGLL
jgi:DNA-binding NarL/FixJ family response regulator